MLGRLFCSLHVGVVGGHLVSVVNFLDTSNHKRRLRRRGARAPVVITFSEEAAAADDAEGTSNASSL